MEAKLMLSLLLQRQLPSLLCKLMVLMRLWEERLRRTAVASSCGWRGLCVRGGDPEVLACSLDFGRLSVHSSSSATVPASWAEISDTPLNESERRWYDVNERRLCKEKICDDDIYLRMDTIPTEQKRYWRRSYWRNRDRCYSYVFDWVPGWSEEWTVVPTHDARTISPSGGSISWDGPTAAVGSPRF